MSRLKRVVRLSLRIVALIIADDNEIIGPGEIYMRCRFKCQCF